MLCLPLNNWVHIYCRDILFLFGLAIKHSPLTLVPAVEGLLLKVIYSLQSTESHRYLYAGYKNELPTSNPGRKMVLDRIEMVRMRYITEPVTFYYAFATFTFVFQVFKC